MTGNRSKSKFVASVALVFFVGVLVGALGGNIYFKARIEQIFRGGPPIGERILERLTEELDLTPTQLEEIRPIVMAIEKKAFDLRRQFLPQMQHLHEQVRDQIRTKLDEKQKRKFDEIHERLKKRFRGRPLFSPPFKGPPARPREIED